MLIDFDKAHRAEVADLKRQLAHAKRHIKELEKTGNIRRQAYINIRDDVHHFCQQWLECLEINQKDWRRMAHAKKIWFEYCHEVFPATKEILAEKMGHSRLFENGIVPTIKHPEA